VVDSPIRRRQPRFRYVEAIDLSAKRRDVAAANEQPPQSEAETSKKVASECDALLILLSYRRPSPLGHEGQSSVAT